MLTDNRLTIAIISYNSHHVIGTCLGELIDSRAFPVVIVDNASADGSGQRLKEKYPHVQVIQSARNIGYGRAANLALNAISTPYFLLINPDLKATPAAVTQLFERMLANVGRLTLLAPAVASKDFTQQGLVDRPWVIGAAMLFDVALLRTVGVFDENIFLFYEETDLCQRIKAAGQHIALDTDLYIEHLYRQSSAPDSRIEYLKDWHFAWSRMYYFTKHGMAIGKHNPYRVLAKYFTKYVLATKATKRARYKARVRGTLAFIRGEKAFLEDDTPQCAPVRRG